jgi:N-acetylglucosamine kinase-like BadF-type ATPase
MTHVLGIDAGGTKTVCLLADAQGQIIAEARGGGANLQTAGELEVEKVLHSVMEDALAAHHVTLSAICLGMAGVDRRDDSRILQSIMRRIGHNSRILVVNDALVALVAGAGDNPGIVVIAGTGSIAYGRNASNQAARAGGWGHLLGDEGSGYWMGREALRAVVRHADGRGPSTSLTGRVLAHFGVAAPPDLVHALYYRDLRPQVIAALATGVQESADEGDGVARRILQDAADELVLAAESVTGRLGLSEVALPCLLSGGIFRAAPFLAAELTRRVRVFAPLAEAELLDVPPAVGAVRLALAEARGGARLPTYI